MKKVVLNDKTLEGELAEREERVADTAGEALAETLKEKMPDMLLGEDGKPKDMTEEEEVSLKIKSYCILQELI